MTTDNNPMDEYLTYAQAQYNLWSKRAKDCQSKADIWKRQLESAKASIKLEEVCGD